MRQAVKCAEVMGERRLGLTPGRVADDIGGHERIAVAIATDPRAEREHRPLGRDLHPDRLGSGRELIHDITGSTGGQPQDRDQFFVRCGDFNQTSVQLDFTNRRACNNFQLASRIDARQRELMEDKRIIEQMMR